MKTDELAAEAMEQIIDRVTHTLTRYDLDLIHTIIQAAIEKARGIKTTEYAKGWDDHVAAVRAAHASEPWHPCEHCKIFGKSVEILDSKSYLVGEARDWASAVALCKAHNRTAQASEQPA